MRRKYIIFYIYKKSSRAQVNNGPRCAMLVPPPPGDGAGSLASGAGSSAAAATDAADAAGLAGEEDPVPDPPTGDLYRSRNKSKCGVIRCVSNRDDITRFPRRTREGSRQSEE